MVEPFIGQGFDFIIPMVDARRMEVYTSVFDGKTGVVVSETEAKILDEFSFEDYKDYKVLFVGDGATKAQTVLNLPSAFYKSEVYPSAEYLIKKALEKAMNKEWEDVAYFEPFYLKDFQGVKRKAK